MKFGQLIWWSPVLRNLRCDVLGETQNSNLKAENHLSICLKAERDQYRLSSGRTKFIVCHIQPFASYPHGAGIVKGLPVVVKVPQVFWAAHTETDSSPASQEILEIFFNSKISLPRLLGFETLHSVHLNSISHHDTYQCTFYIEGCSITLLLHGSTSFKISSGRFKPKFKICINITNYKMNSYNIHHSRS